MLLVVDSKRHHAPFQSTAILPIRCRLYGPGREDWNRGLRELRHMIVHQGRLSRMADGAIRLHGILGVDLRLDTDQVGRIRREGLQMTSSELEINIRADAFEKALVALPSSGAVLPFVAPPQAIKVAVNNSCIAAQLSLSAASE